MSVLITANSKYRHQTERSSKGIEPALAYMQVGVEEVKQNKKKGKKKVDIICFTMKKKIKRFGVWGLGFGNLAS